MKKFIKKEIIDEDIYKIFKPQISPKKMLQLEIFGGSYFGLKIKKDPLPWIVSVLLQLFNMGGRLNNNEIQIKR